MTPWEIKLWTQFLRYNKVKFRRQQVIGNYIVDFYSPKARLIIELDGSGHYIGKAVYEDKERDEKLRGMGFKVLRISNNYIDENFEGVCEKINEILETQIKSD